VKSPPPVSMFGSMNNMNRIVSSWSGSGFRAGLPGLS